LLAIESYLAVQRANERLTKAVYYTVNNLRNSCEPKHTGWRGPTGCELLRASLGRTASGATLTDS
jgi:hypothetical protein